MALSYVTHNSVSNNRSTTAPEVVFHARHDIIHTGDKVHADLAMYFASNDIHFKGEHHNISKAEILSAAHAVNIEASDITAHVMFIVAPELHIDSNSTIHSSVYIMQNCKQDVDPAVFDGRTYLVSTLEDMEMLIHSYIDQG